MTTMFAALAVLLIGAEPVDGPLIAPAPRPVTRPTEFYGHVLAVDAKSITIRGTENGLPNDEVVDWRFPAGKALAAGEPDPAESASCSYRLSDVRVGDRVYIRIHHVGNENVCASVIIRRRPGGVIPRAPWEDPNTPDPYHEYANAWQAFEERGVPLPAKYDPVIQRLKSEEAARADKPAQDRRLAEMRARFARQEQEWQRDHTAPPPREVRR